MVMPALLLLCLLFGAFFHTADAFSAEIPGGMPFPVQAAIVQENGDPIIGAVLCAFDTDCTLLAEDAQGFRLSLKVPYGRHCFLKRLSLRCVSGDCSFLNGSSSVEFGEEREFPFFEGSFGRELVYRQRTKLGSVLLIAPDFINRCRMPSSMLRRS